jgi:hypothetical protein
VQQPALAAQPGLTEPPKPVQRSQRVPPVLPAPTRAEPPRAGTAPPQQLALPVSASLRPREPFLQVQRNEEHPAPMQQQMPLPGQEESPGVLPPALKEACSQWRELPPEAAQRYWQPVVAAAQSFAAPASLQQQQSPA